MAGDWIKMTVALSTSPKVVRIVSATDADKCPHRVRVVGALHAVWCLFDQHSTDGRLRGYTLEMVDEVIGWPGFAQAMADVGWLAADAEGIDMPEFERHNGAPAKRRAQEADRKRSVRNTSASDADKKRTREEKRIVNPIAPFAEAFNRFWRIYPRKVAKQSALKAWTKIQLTEQLVEIILAALERHLKSAQWLRDDGKFIPHPATWLNGRRWEDEPPPPRRERFI